MQTPPEFVDLVAEFDRAPRWARWALSLLVFLACAWEWASPRAPEEPRQVFIVTLLIYAALFVASELLRPKPKIESARPSGLGDFTFPTATEARVLPLVWGRVMLEGPNVVWYGDLQQDAITERIKTGLWSSTKVTKGYSYHVGVQMSLCRMSIAGIRRAWIGDVIVYDGGLATTSFDVDLPELHGGDDLGQGGVQATVDVFLGTDVQAPSDYLAMFQDSGAGTTRTPRYTGTAYLVARSLGGAAADARGAYLGNSTSIKPWKFEIERYSALFSGQSAGQDKVGVDANPVNVIYEVLTNAEWGFGFPAADVDVGPGSSFLAASDALIAEGNGFSMILDRLVDATELVQELQRQVDGVVFLDHRTGKWRIKLARADYAIGSIPQLSPANMKEVKDYTRGAWDDTTNQVTVKFVNRANDYKESFALAQDVANALIQGGGTVSTTKVVPASPSYPGVQTAALAAVIAWRDLRALSYPLARCTLVVTREFWDLTVGDVVALTDPDLGLTQLPMRITTIDYGRLQENEITLTVVQDVFQFLPASFGAPPATGWTAPAPPLVAYPADEQLAFEAPRALLVRDPDFDGDVTASKILAAARRQVGEAAVSVRQRNAAGAPSGAFTVAGSVTGFLLVGEMSAALPAGVANPTTSILVVASPDSQAAIEAAFDDSTTAGDLGVNLTQLVMVDQEFMLVQGASVSGPDVLLSTIYRGVLDSGQQAHATGAKVYLLHVGAGIADEAIPYTNNVEVELRMRDATSTFGGVVTAVAFAMAKRVLRPYPPAASLYNGSGTPFGTPSLEGVGGPGLNDFRVDVRWWRREYRINDEAAAMLADNDCVDTSTEHQLEVRADPDGIDVLVGAVSAWTAGAGPLPISRADVVTAAPAGTPLRVLLRSRHDVGTEVDLQSRHDLAHDVTPTSSLTGQFYLGGGLAANVPSASYEAQATGTYTLSIGAAQATAAIQVSINGAAFSTVIAAGLTTGTFAATVFDLVRVRRTVSEAPNPQFVELKNPSSVAVAYGTFKS